MLKLQIVPCLWHERKVQSQPNQRYAYSKRKIKGEKQNTEAMLDKIRQNHNISSTEL